MAEMRCSACKKNKDVQLFSPAQWRHKYPVCRLCLQRRNKEKAIKNAVPADIGFGFHDRLFTPKGK